MLVNGDVKPSWYSRNKEKQLELNRKRYAADPERERAYRRESYHKTKDKPEKTKYRLWKNAKHRANSKQLPFDIVPDDIVLPEVCPILGVPFNKSTRRYSYSIDRKDPKLGYTKENIWIITQIANAMKWDSTQEERLAFAKWALSSEKVGPSC